MAYIEKEQIIKFIAKGLNNPDKAKAFGHDAIEILTEIVHSPNADVVEVVRCKDCKHRNTPDCKMWYKCVICGDCHHWERDEYFCSYGERKE